jgi:hypothetical protein
MPKRGQDSAAVDTRRARRPLAMRGVRCGGCRRTARPEAGRGFAVCGVNWANCAGFSLATGGAGVEPGVRSSGFTRVTGC